VQGGNEVAKNDTRHKETKTTVFQKNVPHRENAVRADRCQTDGTIGTEPQESGKTCASEKMNTVALEAVSGISCCLKAR